ncbi:glycosyltransferase [Geotalea uraniireducens]|uniref:Glycosyl transferase, group 1 n=1 Tax=Geotalea uraniireducens (strain Rf4) TaxID=351605 RepID=A5G835_GEOUR|nr:glycosyltransferase [Geotalea uraniireducens]ABQ27953.1 glycosyl transferase, group 1 [Geotalea uraniireducens Rf4]
MKRILVMNFFPAFSPPASGGELRYFHLYNYLSKFYDVTLLSPTFSHHQRELIEHSQTFRECRVPKESIHHNLHIEMDKEKIGTEVSALVCSLSAKSANAYHDMYLELYPKADIIIHESPYMLEYDLFFGFDNKPRIYNSYNSESVLVSQMWTGPNAPKYIDHICELEKRLISKADLVFATSRIEADIFIHQFGACANKVKLAPNGIIPGELNLGRRTASSERKKAIFIGSAHPPNIEAVEFIVYGLCDRCPSIDFYIAGSCCDNFNSVDKPNVYLCGRVDEQQKNALFESADIAINPMFSGAGTNLKTLEFLSSGIPLVSTDVGARGLDLIDRRHFFLATHDNFSEALNMIISNSSELNSVAASGQNYIDSNYSWEKIAGDVHIALEHLEREQKKPFILLLNDFEVSNPVSGGEIRINRLYVNLSKYYRILLFCLNNTGNLKQTAITPDFVEVSFPKTPEHIREEHKQNKGCQVHVTDIVNSYMGVKNNLLLQAVRTIESTSGVVIFVHPYMASLLEVITNRNVIYESLNCETELKASMLSGRHGYRKHIKQVEYLERLVAKRSCFIVSVSDDDHPSLKKLAPVGTEIVTVKNGVDIDPDFQGTDYASVKEIFNGHPIILFIGSAHKPNIDALSFIVGELAPVFSNCYFAIVGTVCGTLTTPKPSNVLLFNKLDELYKDVILRISDVAINPMFSGSGSNLKLAEYFAYQLPVVTTLVGARGYNIEHYRDALVCERSQFSSNLSQLLGNKALQETLSQNGYDHARKFLDWAFLAKRFHGLLQSRLLDTDIKRLLVVTYRFTDPPLGGAEVYLLNVIKQLDSLGTFFIHLVAPDIYDIHNKFHFSTEFTSSVDSHHFLEENNVSITTFPTDKLPNSVMYRNAKELFMVWMKEFVESSLRYIGRYTEPLLMGGWHFPEKMEERLEIWSSNEALVFVDGAHEILISALSPKKRSLKIYADEKLVYNQKQKGVFDIRLELKGAKIIKLLIDPVYVEKVDPRPLGIRVFHMACLKENSNTAKEIKFDRCYRDFLREFFLDEYVSEMIQIARHRDVAVDNLFQTTRGPNSKQLEEWLDAKIKNYDVVLGHSIPFKTSILATNYAKKHGKPVVLLPHFHFDDEFYHWNSYYTALQRADSVITSPKASIPFFYEKINAKTRDVPGGGVFKEEFENVDSASFAELYGSELPFVLVLGRKSGAKNYSCVIEAVKKVNQEKRVCEVVLIGKNEDGRAIEKSEAIYLGEQARKVVLGALQECMCVINMSESESFGIVVLEAWMMKKPVIANEKCPAFVELVDNGINGLLAAKHSLCDTIKFIIDNPNKAKLMGNNGFEKVSDNYTWESIGKKINTLLIDSL